MTPSRPRLLLAAAASLALAIPLCAQAPTSVMKPSPAPASPASAPPPPTAAPTPTREAIAQGRVLFAKVVEWLGGPQKIASVKDVRTRGRLTAKTGEGDTTMEVQSAMAFPYHLLQEVDSPFGRVVMVVTPSSAFLASSNGTQDLPPAAADELRKQIVRIPLNLTRNASDPKLVVSRGRQGDDRGHRDDGPRHHLRRDIGALVRGSGDGTDSPDRPHRNGARRQECPDGFGLPRLQGRRRIPGRPPPRDHVQRREGPDADRRGVQVQRRHRPQALRKAAADERPSRGTRCIRRRPLRPRPPAPTPRP